MSARTVTEIAAGVRAGTLKAVDVLEQHLAAIEAREPEVHAFNLVTAEAARERAAAIDAAVAAGDDPGPLAGVPVALKDNMCTRGVPTTCSSQILAGWKPPLLSTSTSRSRTAAMPAFLSSSTIIRPSVVLMLRSRCWSSLARRMILSCRPLSNKSCVRFSASSSVQPVRHGFGYLPLETRPSATPYTRR